MVGVFVEGTVMLLCSTHLLLFHVWDLDVLNTLWDVAGWGRNRSKFAIHGSVAPFAGIRARKFLILTGY